jgi:hypothetical protein
MVVLALEQLKLWTGTVPCDTSAQGGDVMNSKPMVKSQLCVGTGDATVTGKDDVLRKQSLLRIESWLEENL